MSDQSIIVGLIVIGIVAIVAICLGSVFRAKIDDKGVQLDAEPPEEPRTKRRKKGPL
jgi:hypothetical protein